MKALAAAILCLGLAAVTPAHAQNADVVFWQSIQNSTNPAEYQAYLETFPNGMFANLARIRLGNMPAPGTVVAPVGTVPPAGTVVVPSGGPILLTPSGTVIGPAAPAPAVPVITTTLRVRVSTSQTNYSAGQPVVVSYAGMPPYQGEYIIIVPVGTTETALSSSWMQQAANRDSGSPTGDAGAVEFSPLPPGNYEARVLSRALNVGGTWQVIGRHAFSVQ